MLSTTGCWTLLRDIIAPAVALASMTSVIAHFDLRLSWVSRFVCIFVCHCFYFQPFIDEFDKHAQGGRISLSKSEVNLVYAVVL